ncbi:hypothetical protein I312_101435 [Cryptococcus bacillisporus CA1280]|uniref:protein-tyrosine-phosphatase n=1 Tax=Cryptococcus bacillisporus CA1280 TaxID=1296109 RepID=A0A0D0VNG7_CRYGA|nr:MAP kinase phosphatase [Cryptococcus bacillisporus CA1280]
MQSQQHTHDNNAPPAARPQPLHVVHSPTIPPPNRGSRNLKVPLTAPLPSRTTEVRSPNRRRPSPLVLGKPKEADPEDWQIHQERPFTASPGASDTHSLDNELQDLSKLRKAVRQNLLARPMDSPLDLSDSDLSAFNTPGQQSFPSFSSTSMESIPIEQVFDQVESGSVLLVDTRPMAAFLNSHLPNSIPLSIPTLLSKRFQRSQSQSSHSAISWGTLSPFVSLPSARERWDLVDQDKVEVALICHGEEGRVVEGILKSLIDDRVKTVRGGWAAVLKYASARRTLVSGQTLTRPSLDVTVPETTTGKPLAPGPISNMLPPKSAPPCEIPLPPIPPSPSLSPPKPLNHHPSLPSLRPPFAGATRDLPSLSINASQASQRRTPKLSLNLDRPLKSAIFGGYHDIPPTPHGYSCTRTRPQRSPGLSLNIPRTPFQSQQDHIQGRIIEDSRLNGSGSIQTRAHEQSRFPPSSSTFGDAKQIENEGEDMVPNPYDGPTPRARIPHDPDKSQEYGARFYSSPPSMDSTLPPSSPPPTRPAVAPFNPSVILPSFLYLGPDIQCESDVQCLLKLGVKRILNVALECDDNQGLNLKERFKYRKVGMRDIVEESGVGKGMRDACEFLDDARLHSAPTYVHCQAGKSRSVTIILAYLIHANAWTLKTSYAYVAERRKGISPNIGFVAELMQWEEKELGVKQSGGVHGDGNGRGKASGGGGGNGGSSRHMEDEEGDNEGRGKTHLRDSLPPTWSSSVDTYTRPARVSSPVNADNCGEEEAGREGRIAVGDEREVRKNGVWVHHRRAPVDRTTLQPGRRVSKAGLESLRTFMITSTDRSSPSAVSSNSGSIDNEHQINNSNGPETRPSPRPSPGMGKEGHAMTPAGDGPLRWI